MTFQKCDIFELKTLKEPTDYLSLANNPETLEKIEGCMKVWIKQTEQVIIRKPSLVSDTTLHHFTELARGGSVSYCATACPHILL